MESKKDNDPGSVEPPRKGRLTNQLHHLRHKVFLPIWKHHFAWPFHNPVDPEKLNLPDYFEIIKHPMDLNLIKKKLDTHQYWSGEQCIKDFNLMFSNCYIYNKNTDDVVLMAQTLEKIFLQKIREMPKDEYEIQAPVKGSKQKGKGKKMSAACSSMKGTGTITRKQTQGLQPPINQAVHSTIDNSYKSNQVAMLTSNGQKLSTISAEVDEQLQKLPLASKKGIKRKADTTTPVITTVAGENPTASASPDHHLSHHEAGLEDLEVPGRIQSQAQYRRQSSGRQIRPPRSRDLDSEENELLNKRPRLSKLSDQLKFCNGILKELFTKRHSAYTWPFQTSVDAKTLPDYYVKIKQPMDLGTMRMKMENREYDSAEEFRSDIQLVIDNCRKYNPVSHEIIGMAKKLEDTFNSRWSKLPDNRKDQFLSNKDFGGDGLKREAKRRHPQMTSEYTSSSSSDDSDDEEREKIWDNLQAEVTSR